MEKLNFNNKQTGDPINHNEWNALVTATNDLIDSQENIPTTAENGKSAYELYLETVNEGETPLSLEAWLASLKGQDGEDGNNGLSAYEIAVANGYNGTIELWLLSLKGADGVGSQGVEGKSAYLLYTETTLDNPVKTLQEWLNSLKGQDGSNGTNGTNGSNGKSAYELAIDNGFEGTVLEWLASLHGLNGTNGSNGSNGSNGITPHIDPTTKHWMIGDTDTNIVAEGNDGITPLITTTPITGGNTVTIYYGSGDSRNVSFNVMNGTSSSISLILANWNESDSNSAAYILNKPTIPSNESASNGGTTLSVVTTGEKYTWNNKSNFSGNYNDLTNKPTIPDALILSDWGQSDNTAKDFIKNKPTIPNEVTEQTVTNWGFTKNTGTSTFSGSYNDLTDKPTIPAAQVQSDWNASSGLGQILNKPVVPKFYNGSRTPNNLVSSEAVLLNVDYLDSGVYGIDFSSIARIWTGTQAQYTALSPNYNANTIYIIT